MTPGAGPDQLLAMLSAMAAVDAASLPPARARAELLTLLQAANALQALVAIRVDAFDRARAALHDGLRTTRAWLRGFAGLSLGAATAILARGRLYRVLPQVAERATAGLISAEHADRISNLAGKVGSDRLVPMDALLADLASDSDPAGLAHACGHLHATLEPGHPEPDPLRDFEARSLTMAKQGSMLALRGRLDPEGGALVQTALDALIRPPGPADVRTPEQRRADALVELARLPLNEGVLPTVAGQRPHLAILITAQTLIGDDLPPDPDGDLGVVVPDGVPPEWSLEDWIVEERPDSPDDYDDYIGSVDLDDGIVEEKCVPGRRDILARLGLPERPEPAHLGWIGAVPAELARRIACDADVWRVVLSPTNGLPLDVGRAYRIVPAWMRRALYARDRGRRWPGCDAPPQWCDAHHLDPWYLGGTTTIGRLVLLCRFHHVLVHEGRWRIYLEPDTGELAVTRPSGRPYELNPSHPWISPNTRRGHPT